MFKRKFLYPVFCIVFLIHTIHSIKMIPPEIILYSNQQYVKSPYISGDAFRSLGTFFIDEFRAPFNTDDIQEGDVIFLGTYYLDFFFTQVHPYIACKYILITHNSDISSPGRYVHMLDDEKIIAWFAQNIDLPYLHPKLFPIPIGIANKQLTQDNIELLDSLVQKATTAPKKYLLYLNFAVENNQLAREEAVHHFRDKSFCYYATKKPWHEYLVDLVQSKFIISPAGNGLDCYRTWEALLMGAIPIVKTSSLDKLYADLPVIIINSWQEVTENFLNNKWQEMKLKPYNKEKIYARYWIEQIKTYQKNFHQKEFIK